MPAHVFVTNRENLEICLQRGVAGIPSAQADRRNAAATNDALVSRVCIVREDDYLLFYVTGENALFGIWQVEGSPFYDETTVWADRTYPFRVRFRATQYSYPVPIKLHDIYDMQNEGKIWTFALKRSSGSNAMFSLTDAEFLLLQNEYAKLNPFSNHRHIIQAPYPVVSAPLIEHIHLNHECQLKYEAGVMAYMLTDLTAGKHKAIFGNYTDYLCYVPTTIGSEMDILLSFGNPFLSNAISSYDILELKRDVFDLHALTQLIGYETWFLQKKVSGDQKMLRTTAVARVFPDEVVQYVRMREEIEKKPIKLIQYSLTQQNELALRQI